MPRTRNSKEEVVNSEKKEAVIGVNVACQTEDWTDERMRKYRAMKRKLIELIAVSKHFRGTLIITPKPSCIEKK